MIVLPAPHAVDALAHPALGMPPPEFAHGPAHEMRGAMARFGDGLEHQRARAVIDRLLVPIDEAGVRAIADRRAREVIAGGAPERALTHVPLATMAEALHVLPVGDGGDHLEHALRSLGAVIAAPPGGTTGLDVGRADDAARWLGSQVGFGARGIALVSILHQTRGAVAELVDLVRRCGAGRPPAVAATHRITTAEIDAGPLCGVAVGTVVRIELDREREFGHGAHSCPGQSIAEWLVSTIVSVLGESPGGCPGHGGSDSSTTVRSDPSE